MGVINLGDFTGHHMDCYEGDYLRAPDNRKRYQLWGWAKLTDTLQTSIPLLCYALTKKGGNAASYPPKPLVIPSGAQIDSVGLSLPAANTGATDSIYGAQLPKNCTIIGTTGENLKVSPTTGTTHTVTAPVITSASNAYTAGTGAVVSRAAGVADAVSPSLLLTLGSATTYQITVSNAGNTAAGNGIRLSLTGAIAFIVAEIWYTLPPNPPNPYLFDMPPIPD